MCLRLFLTIIASSVSGSYKARVFLRKIERALALHRRGEARSDGLLLTSAKTTLHIALARQHYRLLDTIGPTPRECDETSLDAAGSNWDRVFKTTWYVTDNREWDAIRPVAEKYFGRPVPAPTVVDISKLVLPSLRFEPDMWATLPG